MIVTIIIITLLAVIACAVAPEFMLAAVKVIGYLAMLAAVIGVIVAIVAI